MPSPFPGMDPYLEDPAQWPDFHLVFIHWLRKTLNDRLPAGSLRSFSGLRNSAQGAAFQCRRAVGR